MMTSQEIRQKFLDFFKSKDHLIVPSAPIVVKDDPSLMFINAGMNQFKDVFLDIKPAKAGRVADVQKCLRVSGKHNDLEEVGRDSYHHTMFEMLGNWSFGDYFKKEAIEYAWEFLTEILQIPQDRLYATVFEGHKEESLEPDDEAFGYWKKYLPDDHILFDNKKNNFWEMGEQGPCGPCSEIHIDLRDDDERRKLSGAELVNKDNPLVIELWNLVFIQYNRLANGSLEKLPTHHVDTGMGFERLCMVVQNKTSNYDTDLFTPLLKEVEKLSSLPYGNDEKTDIAMRVVSDHLRAVSFAIADGQLPSNTGAGYVIRRILRRAIRYGFTFLHQKEPFIYKLLPTLMSIFGDQYSELQKQKDFITKVILQEERAFLNTLEKGLLLLDGIIAKTKKANQTKIDGATAFVLYDTYGFPKDLTQLILEENDLHFSDEEFNAEMQKQKQRSRQAAETETEDWQVFFDDSVEEFVGYDQLEASVKIAKARIIKDKKQTKVHLVFNITPFYAEGGGQAGDTGYIENEKGEKIEILNTIKEHDLIIHVVKKMPQHIDVPFRAVVDAKKRLQTARNHTATHLLHYALRQVLGTHVEQKGSLVDNHHLRFDFSHFQKVTDDELKQVELFVNDLIMQATPLEEKRQVPINEAVEMGAMALFGEKYGDVVRVVRFGKSVELCGGTHVENTGNIGLLKITVETSVSAGIRRIEAVTGDTAVKFVQAQNETINNITSLLKVSGNLTQAVSKLKDDNILLEKQVESLLAEQTNSLVVSLAEKKIQGNDADILVERVNLTDANQLKQLGFLLRKQNTNLIFVIGTVFKGKPQLLVGATDDVVKNHDFHAGKLIKEIATEIRGGGGGQPFLATAGGNFAEGLNNALNKAKTTLGV